MNEKVLKIILKLYVILAQSNRQIQPELAKLYVESHLKKLTSSKSLKKYLDFWDNYVKEFSENPQSRESDFLLNQAVDLCKNVNKNLTSKQRLVIVVNILQLSNNWQSKDTEVLIDTIAKEFKLPADEYNDLKYFIFNAIHKIVVKRNLLLVTEKSNFPISDVNLFVKQGIGVQFFIIFIPSINTYLFKYEGGEKLQYEGKILFANEIYQLDIGTTIYNITNESSVLYYSEVVSAFLRQKHTTPIYFNVNNIEFTYKSSENGIKPFCFQANMGELVGIMGSSGAGKSTLLDLFAGNKNPDKGEVLINGYNVYTEKAKLEGQIGFIPQDDLLNENLTVYQNLYYNAKLCFGDLTEFEIEQKVTTTLTDLELHNSRHLKVGSVLDKVISGGQRKRLNIAFELIRKPSVLFVDEPTSGLSSSDSERVINQLKAETIKGNVVFINIHQPSSNIFRQFDKLIILDQEGYVIYTGNPIEAIGYFKKHALETEEIDNICHSCQNVIPDKILDYVELKEIGEIGETLQTRKIAPREWYGLFKEHFVKERIHKKELPKSSTSKPGYLKQFKVFFTRNLLSKLNDKQYVILGTLVTPLLALILSLVTKHLHYTDNGVAEYLFYYNQNIPAYFLMSIIVALFVGLIISAEEIIHDKKIRRREKFLNLSQMSYINSKVLFLLLLSSLQSIIYAIIGNSILEIKDFIFPMWLTLFSLLFFGNMVGLIISSTLKSLVAIYIIIPIVLVPQILLSGVIVKFDELHPSIASKKVVPVVGDLMPSRWAYEALMVEQFTHNMYNVNFFDIDRKISYSAFNENYVLPELLETCYNLEQNIENRHSLPKKSVALIKNELGKIAARNKIALPAYVNNIDEQDINLVRNYIRSLRRAFSKSKNELFAKKEKIVNELTNRYGADEMLNNKLLYTNERINDFVLNRNSLDKMLIVNNEIVNTSEPVYKTPESNIGRAHLFSSYKKIGHLEIHTFVFNILILWLFNITLYILLVFNIRFNRKQKD